jgi:EAL and modified HD-GYP domain-containing signal transduction protein
VRAQFAEQVGREGGFGTRAMDLFLTGMLSTLEALIGRPMEEALAQIPVSQEIRDTLLGRSTTLSPTWNLVLAYERADWDQVKELVRLSDVSAGRLPGLYRDAVQWVDRIYKV